MTPGGDGPPRGTSRRARREEETVKQVIRGLARLGVGQRGSGAGGLDAEDDSEDESSSEDELPKGLKDTVGLRALEQLRARAPKRGRKRWTLYALPEELRRALAGAAVRRDAARDRTPPVPLPGEAWTPEVLERWPLLRLASAFRVQVVVGPGELMVLPPDTAHLVMRRTSSRALTRRVTLRSL